MINPRSGCGSGAEIESKLRQAASERGIELSIQQIDNDAEERIQNAVDQGAKTIIAVGGDGTISNAASACATIHCAGHDIDFGIVPAGTANLIAKALGIPEQCDAAVDLIFGQHSQVHIDAMSLQSQLAFSHVSMGTYSKIAVNEDSKLKRRIGKLAYVVRAFREIASGPRWRFDIVADGIHYQRRASLVMVANISPVGIAGMVWGQHILPNDGVIDICVISAKSLREHASLVFHALTGRTRQSDQIEYLTASSSVKVSANRTLPVRADGEILPTEMIDLQVSCSTLSVIVPATGIK
ncbi:YegS/Rv2252/BmrU family lipid kinase [Stieleria sp. JC731]|uniref:diacylglycerol/lipid kinase family protein n=1 Tax=Stieleria sp. JC731 TaxID=2894195 RepID=UPI001E41056C|nr:YegS/Rv2252/BmrU family lipid kinase [Stieleria sp. JC731]MCC9598949.1 YegS/Rv2252/BmrU family lipid kinase [Stieleria sp. JC731]